MRIMTKLLAGAAGFAALAAATPSVAQYGYGYQSNPYANSYGYQRNPYGNSYGYRTNGYSNGYAYNSYAMNPSVATQQCTSAVQSRLNNRTSMRGIIGALLGANASGQVLSITQATPSRIGMRIRGLATSGRYASNGYGNYGVGAYGALGYGYANQADLSFRCDVDFRGYVRDVSIARRY